MALETDYLIKIGAFHRLKLAYEQSWQQGQLLYATEKISSTEAANKFEGTQCICLLHG